MTFEAASPAQPMHGGTGFGTLRTANLDVTGSTAKEYTLATDADGQMRTWDLASASPAGQSWTTATRPCFVDAGSTWALTVARGKRGRSYRREPTMPLTSARGIAHCSNRRVGSS